MNSFSLWLERKNLLLEGAIEKVRASVAYRWILGSKDRIVFVYSPLQDKLISGDCYQNHVKLLSKMKEETPGNLGIIWRGYWVPEDKLLAIYEEDVKGDTEWSLPETYFEKIGNLLGVNPEKRIILLG